MIRRIPFFLSLISSILACTACADRNGDVYCFLSYCEDENTWVYCNPDTGLPETKTCTCILEKNICLDPGYTVPPFKDTSRCSQNACKDANTLLLCDLTTGTVREVICPCDLTYNRCVSDTPQQPVIPPCTEDLCIDANTLQICDKETGLTTQRTCQCDSARNVCTEDAPRCTEDICLNANTLGICNPETGKFSENPCNSGELCTFGHCEKKSIEDYTCSPNEAPSCIGDTMYKECEDIVGDDVWYPIIQHCTGSRQCVNGQCIEIGKECLDHICKNSTTQYICSEGIQSEHTCAPNELCIQGECIDGQGLTACSVPSDCDSNHTCHQGFCYLKSTFDAKPGDTCDVMTFQEYCQNDIEYKCGYDGTIETNDCARYNGCSLYVKPAYYTGIPVLNAKCRGDSNSLKQCSSTPGIPSYACYRYIDEEFGGAFSFAYSTQNHCIVGTDGRLIFSYMEIQTNCGGVYDCNLETGLCK